MVNSRITRLAAVAVASSVAAGTIGTAAAAPVLSDTVAVKAAQENLVTNVRWGYGWHGGWGPGAAVAGVAAGALIAGAAAGAYYGPGYYAPYPYGPYAYGPPVYYAPGYYGYGYGYYPHGYYGRCFTDDGYGRFAPCSR